MSPEEKEAHVTGFLGLIGVCVLLAALWWAVGEWDNAILGIRP
jgi:hypothetical protein